MGRSVRILLTEEGALRSTWILRRKGVGGAEEGVGVYKGGLRRCGGGCGSLLLREL